MSKKQLDLFDTLPIKIVVDKNKKDVIMKDSESVKTGYNLICEVDATHSGTLINNRIYPPDSMEKGVKSWTKPYKKPVLINHDDTSDPVGRVIKAKYFKTLRGEETKDYKPILKRSDGYGFQRLTVKVTDPTAIQKILDGRYETVSVRMNTDHAWCSICNIDWSNDGPCEHMPGQMYDNKLAYITTGDLSYREVSFVNIPADEFAGVKEALLTSGEAGIQKSDSINISLYANNSEEKVLSSLGVSDSENLYNLLDSDIEESDDVVLHLLEKSSKVQKDNKEEDVKLEDLTREQLIELPQVKELIKEEIAKNVEDTKKSEQEACELRITEEKKDMVSKEEHEKVLVELNTLKGAQDSEETKEEAAKEDAESGEPENETNKDESQTEAKENADKTADEDPAEEGKEEAEAPEEKGEENPEEPKASSDSEQSLQEEIDKLKLEKKKLLDDNVKINSELHKMVAERLYDLKKTLNKPDVMSIKTPDARNKKVEEFAQRSVDSLKDQINDLLLEQKNAISSFEKSISNPGIAPADKTNEVEFSKKAIERKETKKDTLTRLFSKNI